MGLAPENQVRAGLPAGGSRIRTLGPPKCLNLNRNSCIVSKKHCLALREAIRTVLDKPNYRLRASLLAEEFDGIDTRSEILRIVSQVSHISDEDGLRRGEVAENKTTRAHLNANHRVPID
jgi:hypothetical protein